MRMTGIVIDGPSDVALIDHVHLWTLKSVDKALYFLKAPHKVLLEILHDNRKAIINTTITSIDLKISLARMVTGMGCTNNASDVQCVTVGKNPLLSYMQSKWAC